MEIVPAVDIKGGRCVRLFQGKAEEETVFGESPVEQALEWENLGARIVHVVDLDAALKGGLENIAVVEEIGRRLSVGFQYGGGVRDEETLERILAAGARRVVVGTKAVE